MGPISCLESNGPLGIALGRDDRSLSGTIGDIDSGRVWAVVMGSSWLEMNDIVSVSVSVVIIGR